MKHSWISLIAIAAVVAGCGKKEEPVVTSTAPQADEPVVAEAPASENLVAAKVEEVVEEVKKAIPEADKAESEPAALASSLMDQAKKAATTAAASVDWANLSWNDLSSVPYNDKEKLLAWAAPQIDTLKDKLAKAALEKGKLSLSGLGDTGWQGVVKDAVGALESVRNSSPETWELATGALMTAWEALQAEATKYIGEG
jgi:hypothetical protein